MIASAATVMLASLLFKTYKDVRVMN